MQYVRCVCASGNGQVHKYTVNQSYPSVSLCMDVCKISDMNSQANAGTCIK